MIGTDRKILNRSFNGLKIGFVIGTDRKILNRSLDVFEIRIDRRKILNRNENYN